MTHTDIVLAAPVRTAIGGSNGMLKDVPTAALGATVMRETLSRSGLDDGAVGSVSWATSSRPETG